MRWYFDELRDIFTPIKGSTSNVERLGIVSVMETGLVEYSYLAMRYMEMLRANLRERLEPIGWRNVSMPCLISSREWELSGRWETWTTKDVYMTEGDRTILTPTAEELFLKSFTKNYLSRIGKIGTIAHYQIQEKFRLENRVRLITRLRQFVMFDGYSMSTLFEKEYRFFFLTYRAIFDFFLSFGLVPNVASSKDTSMGRSTSYEFWIPHHHAETKYRRTQVLNRHGMVTNSHETSTKPYVRGLELGHIFFFGQSYSERLGIADRPYFSSYGIGITRCLECAANESGFTWPRESLDFVVVSAGKHRERVDTLLSHIPHDIKVVVIYNQSNINRNFTLARRYFSNLPILIVQAGRYIFSGKSETSYPDLAGVVEFINSGAWSSYT